MITFTPLSGAARESRTTPLCYLLQIDDVRILIDCGSPDWAPEPSPFSTEEVKEEVPPWWQAYCEALQKFVVELSPAKRLSEASLIELHQQLT